MLRTIALSALALACLSSVARAETLSLELPAFTAASFESNLDVKIAVGGAQSISISASDKADLDDLRYDVRDGKLRVWRERDIWDYLSFRDAKVSVTITVPSLTVLEALAATQVQATGLTGDDLKLRVSSASTIVASGVDARSITIDASSAGQLVLGGNCEMLHAIVASAATVNSSKLDCVDAVLEGSSGSQSVFFVSRRATAVALSAATISLAGPPVSVQGSESSGGNVEVLH